MKTLKYIIIKIFNKSQVQFIIKEYKMARKEFVRLMESNIWLLDKYADRLRTDQSHLSGFPRQQMSILVRLHQGGRALLKDIARREFVSAPNLCAVFRKLEADGLVLRTVDEHDRRNTWYSVTERGAKLACDAMETFRDGVEAMFSGLSREDETELTAALKTMNKVLSKMEAK